MSIRCAAIAVFFFAIFCLNQHHTVAAGEPGWSPVIIATGSYRNYLQALPIEKRPYRPFHFYGNTVRRLHYHGTPFSASSRAGKRTSPSYRKFGRLSR